MHRIHSLTNVDIAGICAVWAGLCGSLSYALKVQEGHVFKWGEFLIHILTSALFGLMAFEVLDAYGFPPQVSGAVCGMTGWMGTRFARIVEVVIRKKAGVSKEDLAE